MMERTDRKEKYHDPKIGIPPKANNKEQNDKNIDNLKPTVKSKTPVKPIESSNKNEKTSCISLANKLRKSVPNFGRFSAKYIFKSTKKTQPEII